jgi:hypothetical protein
MAGGTYAASKKQWFEVHVALEELLGFERLRTRSNQALVFRRLGHTVALDGFDQLASEQLALAQLGIVEQRQVRCR